MLVNLTDVFTNEGQVQELTVSYDADKLANQLGTFSIKEKRPVELRLTNMGQSKVLVEGKVQLTFVLSCDRCLKDVDYSFDLSFANELISPDYTECDTDEDEFLQLMEGYHLNVDELINNELLLNWPMKVLCKADCKGICKVCGKNLNDGDCGCDDFVPDPRMAAIKNLFETSQSTN